ncbi:MAG: hypothetical protein HOP19_06925 [Acidobacteria bacterium]|nr:hypothetical protein [Acidobacteriota bacterium]
MKILLTTFLSVLLVPQSLAQSKPDKYLNDLRGTVHTVRRTDTVEVKETGKPLKTDNIVEFIETYDRQGNLAEKKSTAGLNLQQSVFSHDGQGRRIEKMADVPPNPLAPPRPAVPGGGERNADFLTLITTYRYDAEKRQLEAATKRLNGQWLWIDTYLFDEKGWVIERARKDKPEDAYGSRFRFVYKHDERGVQVESASYTAEGKLQEKTGYKDISVDSRGNWIKRTATTADTNGKVRDMTVTSIREITYY